MTNKRKKSPLYNKYSIEDSKQALEDINCYNLSVKEFKAMNSLKIIYTCKRIVES